MIDLPTLRQEIRNEVVVTNQLSLDASGEAAFEEIFSATLGTYHANQDPTAFDDADVRRFISGQIRRIAEGAQAAAGGQPVTGALLLAQARDVMARTRGVLDEALALSEHDLRIGPKRLAVSFCRQFLESQSPSQQ